MRKHLSVLALAARGTVWRVLAVTLLAAMAAGALLWLVPAQEHVGSVMGADGTETALYQPCAFSALPAKTGATAVCAVGFAAVLAVLSLNGCGYGAHTGLTVGRLRIRESAFCTWWAVYSGVCLLFYWAVMAAMFPAVLQARMAAWTPPQYYYAAYTVGRQTMLLTVYSGSFLHHLLPVRDALVWVENGLMTVLCAMAAARFSHAQRRGGFSIVPMAALALTVGSFFPEMGAGMNLALSVAAAVGIGFITGQFLKGESDDHERTDFRTAQGA